MMLCDLEVPKEARSVGEKFQLDNSHIRLVPAIVSWCRFGVVTACIFLPHNTSSERFTRVLPCKLDGVAHILLDSCSI